MSSHHIAGYKLGRSQGHRKALYRNLVRSLLIHERIQTTLVKAKAIKSLAERIISMGKKGDLNNRRDAISLLIDEKVVRKVFDDIAGRYNDRPGGYTRILKLGPRKGDGAGMAIIELVESKSSSS